MAPNVPMYPGKAHVPRRSGAGPGSARLFFFRRPTFSFVAFAFRDLPAFPFVFVRRSAAFEGALHPGASLPLYRFEGVSISSDSTTRIVISSPTPICGADHRTCSSLAVSSPPMEKSNSPSQRLTLSSHPIHDNVKDADRTDPSGTQVHAVDSNAECLHDVLPSRNSRLHCERPSSAALGAWVGVNWRRPPTSPVADGSGCHLSADWSACPQRLLRRHGRK